MKTFRTVGSGASQTLEKIENNKIPVYETKAAAEADIANLEVGQIIATKDEGNENALGEWEEVWRQDSDNYILGIKNSLGTWLRIRFSHFIEGDISNGTSLLVLPQEWRPVIPNPNRCVIAVDTLSTRMNALLDIEIDGNIRIYFTSNTPADATVTVTRIFCDAFMNIQ